MANRARDGYGVKKQTAFDTGIITGMVPIPVMGAMTTSDVNAVIKSARQNDDDSDNLSSMGVRYQTFSLPMELDATDSMFFIEQFLGDNTDAVDTPVAGANTHTVIATSTAADVQQMFKKGFSLGSSGTDDSKGYYLEGCIISSLEIGEAQDGVYPFTAEGMGHSGTEGTVATTGSVAPVTQLFTSAHGIISSGVDSSEVALPMTVGSIRFEREGIEPHSRAADTAPRIWVAGDSSKLLVSGTVELEMSDTEYAAVIDDYNNNDTLSVQFVFTSPVMITGATPYSLSIDMPECKLTLVERRTDGHLRFGKFTFTAGTGTGAFCTIVATNGVATIPS